MATFFVGQRVRVKAVDNDCCACRVGSEARIIGDRFSPIYMEEQWVILVGSDDYHVVKRLAANYLEPILPDGHRACDDDFKRDLDRLLERQGIAA